MKYTALLFLFLVACAQEKGQSTSYEFDLQGHRGARGLLPENTIPSFLKAAEIGVDTIEMDLVVTADSMLLVSHEPWFNHKISTKPNGEPVTESEAMDLNIYEMTYEQTQQYDVGKRGNPDFPDQKPMEVTKPLLTGAVQAIENFTEENNSDPVYYNIETKSRPQYYNVMVPEPEVFAQLVYDEISALGIMDRAIIQSFDVNTLIAMHEIDPDVTLALLVENRDSPEANLQKLGFTPDIYSPYYRLVNQTLIEKGDQLVMKIIPWTINEVPEMKRLLEMGVDGIITDYPDRAIMLKK
ncbi:MAG TPA: glycerophosphodiester phosphodiesterase family protein [Balneolaceae bacterium]|nr:glycerophosphodiester phosphodiesterase family protein [Balneolaceae bacterium]